MVKVRETKFIIDLNALKYNLEQIKSKLQEETEIMPVIKANAYGIGVDKVLEVIKELKINMVAVAIVDEGIYLRDIGFKGNIFVLNQPYEDEIEKIYEYNLTVGVSAFSFIDKLGEFGKDVSIHIEIGTGMGRTGINPNRTYEFINHIKKYNNIQVEGMYTHFSSSDSDEEYTRKQINSFNMAVEIGKQNLENLKYIHCSNSAGIVNFPEAGNTLVRPGIILYGYLPDSSLEGKIDVKPVAKLRSIVSYIKTVGEDTSIGYNRTYKTKKETVVATIPIGYADGIRRLLSNNGNVVINGKLVPIIGNICMDSFMVDVTDIPEVEIGTEVFLWDNQNITLEEIAKRCQTINYEILSTISERVVREYI